MTGVTTSKAAIQSCSLIKGNNTLAIFQRSVTKVNTSRLVLPARFGAAESGGGGDVGGGNGTCYSVRGVGISECFYGACLVNIL
jgi:hypothetical protein